jgi:hypothetical protein
MIKTPRMSAMGIGAEEKDGTKRKGEEDVGDTQSNAKRTWSERIAWDQSVRDAGRYSDTREAVEKAKIIAV